MSEVYYIKTGQKQMTVFKNKVNAELKKMKC